jgi:hypothetical protein
MQTSAEHVVKVVFLARDASCMLIIVEDSGVSRDGDAGSAGVD